MAARGPSSSLHTADDDGECTELMGNKFIYFLLPSTLFLWFFFILLKHTGRFPFHSTRLLILCPLCVSLSLLPTGTNYSLGNESTQSLPFVVVPSRPTTPPFSERRENLNGCHIIMPKRMFSIPSALKLQLLNVT